MPFPECDHLEGRKRSICRGEADLPVEGPNGVNAYRAHWGLLPLPTPRIPPSPPAEPPSLLIRGWNFAAAMARWTLAGLPRRTQTEIDVRLAICQTCEFLRNDHCTQCGCACVEQNRLINKLALATETCPLDKWH